MTLDQFNRLPLLLRRHQVMRLTGMSKKKIELLRESGVLEGRRLGGELLYYRESVRVVVGLNGNGKGK